MLIYDVLKKDHEHVRQLLTSLTSMNGKGDPHELVEKISLALLPHSRAEEAVLYNSLRFFEPATEMAIECFREHVEAETILRTLQLKDRVAGDWKKTAKLLRHAIDLHIEEEENVIFPLARQLVSMDEALMMAKAFEKLKAEASLQGLVKNGLELVANMMPSRFTESFRTFHLTNKAS